MNSEVEKTQEELDIEKDISNFKAITAVANQEGGKLLISAIERDILTSVETLCQSDKATEIELRAAAIKLRVNLSMWRLLKGAPASQKIAEDALKDLLDVLK